MPVSAVNITNVMVERLKALEMWFLRRILRISWTELVSNKEVLERAGMERSLLRIFRKRQLDFLGHAEERQVRMFSCYWENQRKK